jgi:hypothetical protein
MRTTTLMLCLMAGLMTSGCIIHHTETRGQRHEERSKPDGVAAHPAGNTGTAG